MLHKLVDTIAAISTAKGMAGIGIIRLSGEKALTISEKIVKKKIKEKIIQYRSFYDKNNRKLDTGIVLFFKKPKSFTGEDLIEFHAHGNDIILNNILINLIKLGARIAEPGEFSFRAYINNKIDILQAESINSLIHSKNLIYNKLILNSLSGNLSKEIKNIKEHLLSSSSEIEATIDFPDYTQFNKKNLIINISIIYKKLITLLRKIKPNIHSTDQIKIIIIGDTNAGKSSLFNFLLKEKRSIITNIPGTTRDFLESNFILNNKNFSVTDTAGLNKNSTCKIEKLGILRGLNQIKNSDIIIFVTDITKKDNYKNNKIYQIILNKFYNKIKVIILKNKIDIINQKEKFILKNKYTKIYTSIKKKLGLNLLLNELKKTHERESSFKYTVNKRQYILLKNTKNKLKNLKDSIKKDIELIFIADKLKKINLLLSEITGENISNTLINKIFSTFCIGK